MTLPARFPICPLCHGVHKGLPDCVGRQQTEAEWMIDRGVRKERALEIVRNRHREGLASLVLSPDPSVINVPPYGAPERAPRPAPEPAPVQEVPLLMPDAQHSPDAAPPASPDWSTYRTFRKRPVIITAVQFGLAEYADVPQESFRAAEYPQWLVDAIEQERVAFRFESENYWYFEVETDEGTMRGAPDDWLIRGLEGELYPCRASVFFASYEPVA